MEQSTRPEKLVEQIMQAGDQKRAARGKSDESVLHLESWLKRA